MIYRRDFKPVKNWLNGGGVGGFGEKERREEGREEGGEREEGGKGGGREGGEGGRGGGREGGGKRGEGGGGREEGGGRRVRKGERKWDHRNGF